VAKTDDQTKGLNNRECYFVGGGIGEYHVIGGSVVFNGTRWLFDHFFEEDEWWGVFQTRLKGDSGDFFVICEYFYDFCVEKMAEIAGRATERLDEAFVSESELYRMVCSDIFGYRDNVGVKMKTLELKSGKKFFFLKIPECMFDDPLIFCSAFVKDFKFYEVLSGNCNCRLVYVLHRNNANLQSLNHFASSVITSFPLQRSHRLIAAENLNADIKECIQCAIDITTQLKSNHELAKKEENKLQSLLIEVERLKSEASDRSKRAHQEISSMIMRMKQKYQGILEMSKCHF